MKMTSPKFHKTLDTNNLQLYTLKKQTPAYETGATTITIPVGHQAGDFMIMWAFNGVGTNVTVPTGWTTIVSNLLFISSIHSEVN